MCLRVIDLAVNCINSVHLRKIMMYHLYSVCVMCINIKIYCCIDYSSKHFVINLIILWVMGETKYFMLFGNIL